MKAKDMIAKLSEYPESEVEILVCGTFVSVESVELHTWSDTPHAPTPREFFVIPIREGQRTTGSLFGGEIFNAKPHAATEEDGNVIILGKREVELLP